MYERVKKLYEKGKIGNDGLVNAVHRGWITEDQFFILSGIPYEKYIKPAEEEAEDAT